VPFGLVSCVFVFLELGVEDMDDELGRVLLSESVAITHGAVVVTGFVINSFFLLDT
jgi:hypothetical protein